jgi:membrane protease YdiL (CAAX protease family)
MIYSILVSLLLFSWVSIYLLEKRNIFTQWLRPASERTKEFFFGLSIAAFFCLLSKLVVSQLSDSGWMLSKSISFNRLVFSFFYDLNSVVSEELLFRGVLLYFLIKYLTPAKGIIISAISFGIYHWFSFGVFGNWMGMIVVFLVTGLMGYVFSAAYEKTKSIILPIGIHLGWNWINNTVFSGGPNGVQIFEPTNVIQLEGLNFFFSFTLYIGIALLLLIFVRSGIIQHGCLENPTQILDRPD